MIKIIIIIIVLTLDVLCVYGSQGTAYISNNGAYGTTSSDDRRSRPDNPVAIALHDGQRNVTDVRSMAALMRGPELASIGRGDLLSVGGPETASFPTRRPAVAADAKERRLRDGRTNGAAATADDRLNIDKTFAGMLDLKITTADMNGFVAAAGPPFTEDREAVEPFRWSDSPIRHLPHFGHPDVWDYDLEGVNWVWN